MQATLPTGMIIEIRGMKVREQRIFSDRRLAKRGGTVGKLVEACTVGVIDAGPYTLTQDGNPPWDHVCQGDRFAAALAIRAETYGRNYDFRWACGSCRSSNAWTVDIIDDLPLRELSGGDLDTFKTSNRFTAEVDGAEVVFKIATGADEQAMAQNARRFRDAPISGALMTRIVEINANGELLKPKDRQEWIEDLSMGDVLLLIEEMERRDCGVETSIGVECSECGAEQEIDLPFDDGFWLPKKKRPTQGR